MKSVLDALTGQHAELDALLVGLDESAWQRAVPDCPGWTVSDVVLHLAQTDELAVTAQEHGFTAAVEGLTGLPRDSGTVDEQVDQMVSRQRGASAGELHARWRAAAAAVRDEFANRDPRDRMHWIVADLPARTLATTRLSECWIHTRDIARAVGVETPVDDRLWHIARLAWRSIPYAFTRAGIDPPRGPVAVSVTVPGGGRWDFDTDTDAATTITGSALDFCLVAARRLDPASADLHADGPDAQNVLALLRTYG